MDCKQWIFDMDGTLTDSMDAVWRTAPVALLQKYGITPEPGLHEKLLSMSLAEGDAYFLRTYALPLDHEGFLTELRTVVPKLYEHVELKPGVRELIARLKTEGASLCICSNTWAEQCRTVLERLGIADAFSFYITAQGAQSKRSPDVFFEAMHRLGGGDPARCAVCEDSLYAVRTACGAGFRVLAVADNASRADEPEIRRLSSQFLADWTQLDWSRV